MQSWTLTDLGLLVGVLLIHALGHFAAMRICGYRNLQMFFIPFFGAAVTGRHLAPAGWKKALVSLMGPIPGISVGVGLTIAAILTWDLRFIPLAAMLLLLNGLNLFPLMPLDGGWFFHAVLFGRNRWSEAVFRVMTGLLMVAGALALGTKIMVIVGIFIVLSCVSAWHAAVVAEKLRGEIPPPLAGAAAIPDGAALTIIGELRTAMPKGKSAAELAELTLQVFDKIHARPPGLFSSFALTGVYTVSLGAALLFGALAIGLKTAPEEMRAAFVGGMMQAEEAQRVSAVSARGPDVEAEEAPVLATVTARPER